MPIRDAIKGLHSFYKSLYFDSATAKETFFLASSGRSGSTWIQEVLNKTGNYRILFEPFHPKKVKLFANWESRQYISRTDDGTEFKDSIQSVVEGRIRNGWIDQDNAAMLPKRRFIKAIRANLFIAWLKVQFPWIRLIFLVRHPFAVARSRLLLGWSANLDSIFSQDNLILNHFSEDIEFLKSISTNFGKQVAFWSIENIVPLRELNDGEAFAIAYEDINDDPKNELDRISSNLNVSTQAISLPSLKKPSKTASWTQSKSISVTEAELEEGWRILTHFGLDAIYGKEEKNPPWLANRKVFSEFGCGN